MAQQTALEQFIEWIDSDCTLMDCVMKAKELLKVEKQQITEAQMDMFYKNNNIEFGMRYLVKRDAALKQAEQYYNETYGK
jgi:hypothetical protein